MREGVENNFMNRFMVADAPIPPGHILSEPKGGSMRGQRVHFRLDVPRTVKPRFFAKSVIPGVIKVRTCHFHPGSIVFAIKVDTKISKSQLKKLILATNPSWNEILITNLVSIETFKKLHHDCHTIEWVMKNKNNNNKPQPNLSITRMPTPLLPPVHHLLHTIQKGLLMISVDVQHLFNLLLIDKQSIPPEDVGEKGMGMGSSSFQMTTLKEEDDGNEDKAIGIARLAIPTHPQ